MIVSKFYNNQVKNFATKMMAGSTKNSKDSAVKRLGIKKFGPAETLKTRLQQDKEVLSGIQVTMFTTAKITHSIQLRNPYGFKKRSSIHVIPQEIPNRKFPALPPFAYHPELYPELALKNPEPTNFKIPRCQPKKKRNRSILHAKVVDPENVQRIDIKNMSQELFKHHTIQAFENYRTEKHMEFQSHLDDKLSKHFGKKLLQ